MVKGKGHSILMLTPNIGIGGAEKVFYQQGQYLQEQNQVASAAFAIQEGQRYFGPTEGIYDLDRLSGKGSAGTFSRWRGRQAALRRLEAQLQTDVCISHMEGANLLNAATRHDRVRRILCVHGTLQGDTAKRGMRKLLFNHVLVPLLYNRAEAVVPVSRAMADELETLGVQRRLIHPIPNYFSESEIRSAMEAPPDPVVQSWIGRTVLLNVGRLSPQKNQGALLSLFLHYHARHPRTCLVLVGDGPSRASLCAQAEASGLRVFKAWEQHRPGEIYDIYFMGAQLNPYPFMKAADVFLLTSTHEGFPLVLGEALTCGLAVVATDCPTGPREILSARGDYAPADLKRPEATDCGILMPPLEPGEPSAETAGQWREAIRMALDPEKAAAWRQAAAQKMQLYSLEAVRRQWEALIHANP